MKILTVDVGGTHIKFLATGRRKRAEFPSGPKMTPAKMVERVSEIAADWKYDGVSIGYPGFVVDGRPVTEPFHLASGWVGFDFKKAFNCPVKILNDAAMQAMGSYQGGRMLFLGLGTGLGSALITPNKDGEPLLQPMELAHLHYKRGHSFEYYLGADGLKKQGKKKWRKTVVEASLYLKTGLFADYVILGGGNAGLLPQLPDGLRSGSNDKAFAGGYALWKKGSPALCP